MEHDLHDSERNTDPAPSRVEAANTPAEYRRQVRNLLATIRAIIDRTARSASSLDDYVAHLGGRVSALARVQEILMRGPLSRADLVEVVDDELLSQGAPRDRVQTSGASLLLDRTTAASLALALHELTTNAIKFGALSSASADGRLSIGWAPRPGDEGWWLLEWREQATLDASAAPPRPGFGFELILKTLPYELDAKTKIELASRGLECDIAFRAGGHEHGGDTRPGDQRA